MNSTMCTPGAEASVTGTAGLSSAEKYSSSPWVSELKDIAHKQMFERRNVGNRNCWLNDGLRKIISHRNSPYLKMETMLSYRRWPIIFCARTGKNRLKHPTWMVLLSWPVIWAALIVGALTVGFVQILIQATLR
jgi:hypothetical protein